MTTDERRALPPEKAAALRRAVRWEWITIGYTIITISVVAMVLGSSQSMKTAWIEDMLSLVPQIAFLLALPLVRKTATRAFPFGKHRAMGIGHLAAGGALFSVGAILAVESAIGLVKAEHPTIGTVQLFGATIWLGWLMVAVMSVIVIGPFIYGRAKMKLARELDNKLLYADAEMAKADWQTNVATIVGVLGVGVGLWWLDGAAAIFISLGIIHDGYRNTSYALRDLMDERARTYDDSETHPLIEEILERTRQQPWVRWAGIRMRDEGQVLHAEIFVVPVKRRPPPVDVLDDLTRDLMLCDWRMQDVTIVPVKHLPPEATR